MKKTRGRGDAGNQAEELPASPRLPLSASFQSKIVNLKSSFKVH